MERPDLLAQSELDTADTAVLRRLMVSRYSCRAFKSNPVPGPVVRRVLELTQLTASWCNAQPWHVIVTGAEATERFRHALYAFAAANAYGISPEERRSNARSPDLPMPEEYTGIYRERRREAGWRLYDSLGIARGDRTASARQAMENFRLFGAPHVLIVSSCRQLGVYGAVDTGGFIGNFMLVAHSFGIASIAQGAIAVYGRFIHEYFNIAADRDVICGISFGYPDEAHPANTFRTDRAPVEEYTTFVSV
jgi:nitroreductase